MTFKMRKAPEHVERQTLVESKAMEDFHNLEELLDWASMYLGLPVNAVKVKFETNYDYEYSRVTVNIEYLEPLERFEKRRVEYEKKLAEYQIWRAENKEQIKEHETREKKAKQNQMAKELKALEAQRAKLETRIKKLKG